MKLLLAGAAAIQFAAIGVAHADLSHRPVDQLHGKTGMWRAITTLVPAGPLWYFLWGRK